MMETIDILLHEENNFPLNYSIGGNHVLYTKTDDKNLWPLISEECNKRSKIYINHYFTDTWTQTDTPPYVPKAAYYEIPTGVKKWFLHIVMQ